ncbi:hypothetical protein RUND412_009056 [Rhizina undulata]
MEGFNPPSPSSTTRESLSRLYDSGSSQLTTLQGKLAQVPDKIQSLNLQEKLANVPDKLQTSFTAATTSNSAPVNSSQTSNLSTANSSQPSTLPPARRHIRTPSTPISPSTSSGPPLLYPPTEDDPSYDPYLNSLASKILYRAGTDPHTGGPLLILCAASFPDARVVDYNKLLPYVLSVLPGEDEFKGKEDAGYSLIFFSGGGKVTDSGGLSATKGNRPSWGWTLQAYHLLGRAVRKRIKKLWIVHERAWVRILFEMLAGVVSVKFKKKVVHVNTLADLSRDLNITKLNIPPAVYLHDRKITPLITIAGFPPPPVFNRPPFQQHTGSPLRGDTLPLPKVLVDTSRYIRSSCLSVEGLFRVPPSQVLLDIVKEAYDRDQFLKLEDYGPHITAGLVKLYYRSLPEPIVPVQCYEEIMALDPIPAAGKEKDITEKESHDEEMLVRVRNLLESPEGGLPKNSRILLLRHLLPLLALVAQNSAVNKMTPSNLAVCIAASLVRSDDMMADAKASSAVRKFIEIGIERIEELAPKLPLRRGGGMTGGRRDTIESSHRPTPMPGSPPVVVHRKKVPSVTAAMGEVVITPLIPSAVPLPRRPVPFNPALVGPAGGVALPAMGAQEKLRRGSVPAISTIQLVEDAPQGGDIGIRRQASIAGYKNVNSNYSNVSSRSSTFPPSPNSSSTTLATSTYDEPIFGSTTATPRTSVSSFNSSNWVGNNSNGVFGGPNTAPRGRIITEVTRKDVPPPRSNSNSLEPPNVLPPRPHTATGTRELKILTQQETSSSEAQASPSLVPPKKSSPFFPSQSPITITSSPSSSLAPPQLPQPARPLRRSSSYTFPSSSKIAAIANSLNQQAQQQQSSSGAQVMRPPIVMNRLSKTPPPPSSANISLLNEQWRPLKPVRAKTDVGIGRGGGLVSNAAVAELRALYEERANGVEVLVRSGVKKGRGG